MQKEVMGYLKEEENPYRLKIGDMVVELKYSENNKEINECMKNILRQKNK